MSPWVWGVLALLMALVGVLAWVAFGGAGLATLGGTAGAMLVEAERRRRFREVELARQVERMEREAAERAEQPPTDSAIDALEAKLVELEER